MGQLVLQVVGGGVGFFLGGTSGASMGWSLGGMLGGALFPPDPVELPPVFGPRLGDLKVQQSTYGNSVPRVYGTARIAGNVIWSTDITETATTTTVSSGQSGGKGGGGGEAQQQQQTTYSYSVSFAVALCEGPIIGIRRVWANGKLIYNVGEGADPATVLASSSNLTIYLGTETQLPSALMEASKGAGNVPGYRGTAYVEFSSLQLAQFGNRMPNMEFEVAASGTKSAISELELSSTAGVYPSLFLLSKNGVLWTESTNQNTAVAIDVATNTLLMTITPASGDRFVGFYVDDQNYLWAWDYNNGSPSTSLWRIGTDGSAVEIITNLSTIFPNGYGSKDSAGDLWMNTSNFVGGVNKISSISIVSKTATVTTYDSGYTQTALFINAGDISGRVYARSASNTGTLGWGYYNISTGAFTHLVTTQASTIQPAGIVDSAGFIYTFTTLDSGTSSALAKFDQDGTLLDTLTFSPALVGPGNLSASLALTEGGELWVRVAGTGQTKKIFLVDPDDLSLTGTLATTHELVTGKGFNTHYGVSYIPTTNPLVTYLLVPDGIVTAGSADLADVVESICLLSDLTAADIDVSDLTGVSVDGYVVSQRGPLRGMLEPLARAFFFDAVESDNVIKFVRRGGTSVVTIPLADLSAREGDPNVTPESFEFTRKQEMELPVELNVTYLARENNYQVAQQGSKRLASRSQSQVSVQLPIVMSDDKARQVADAVMYSQWQERMTARFATGRKYAKYEPSDVATIESNGASQIVRLLQKDEGANGVINWSCVLEDSSVYTQTGEGGAPADIFDNVIPLIWNTVLVLMDAPLLRDADDTPGFYYAAAGSTSRWHGEQLYQSKDAGTVYTALAGGELFVPSTMGVASSTLGAHSTAKADQFDEYNTVDIVMTQGELESVTRLQMFSGSNAAMLGGEIIQFRTADLVDTDTYRLSGLLRGRLGSESFMATHAANENFVLLNSQIGTIADALTDLNQSYLYKPVTVTRTLGQTVAQAFTDTGRRLKPLAPVHLAAGKNDGGDWLIQWIRRTRFDASWHDSTDAALGETTEAYEVDIMNGSTVVRTISATSEAATYTAAEQTTDFGAPTATLTVNIYQISSVFGRGYVATRTF